MADSIQNELLRAMGSQAREEIEAEDRERVDRRWDDYCSGKLDGPQTAALLAESAGSRETRLAAELFEPLDEDFKASLVRALRQETPSGDRRDSEGNRRGASLGRRWRRILDGLLGTGQVLTYKAVSLRLAAVAAVVALVVLYPVTRPDEGPIPRFELALQGARAERSGGGREAQIFQRGQRFNFRLQPGERLEVEPRFRVYARREGGRLERWRTAEEAAETSAEGVVLAKDLDWEWGSGRWTLYFAIGRSLPSEAELRRLLDRGLRPESESWQLLTREVRVED